MKKQNNNFVDPETFSIIIPYKDFEKIMKMAFEVEDMKVYIKRMEQQYGAIQEMFREALEKIAEINRYL